MSTPGPIHPRLAQGDYPFTSLEARSRELCPPGVDPIYFSIGDPREETPDFIRQALRDAVPVVSSYPTVVGEPALRRACAGWVERRFGVQLDPDAQVLPVNGTKEAVFSLAFSVLPPGSSKRTVVIPTPAYPVYAAGARFAGGEIHEVPLTSADGWRFDPAHVPDAVWEKTALLWLNVPHNPTGAMLDDAGYERTLALARRFGFWVAADEAYSEVYFDRRPRSALEFGTDNVLALHTLSKRSAMTGYRSGFMAGDAKLVDALRRFRPNVGAATPDFVQDAAIAAWGDDAHTAATREVYAAKRRLFLAEFARRGWKVEASQGTF
jgi:LL-diaminopimelate aminotransferase